MPVDPSTNQPVVAQHARTLWVPCCLWGLGFLSHLLPPEPEQNSGQVEHGQRWPRERTRKVRNGSVSSKSGQAVPMYESWFPRLRRRHKVWSRGMLVAFLEGGRLSKKGLVAWLGMLGWLGVDDLGGCVQGVRDTYWLPGGATTSSSSCKSGLSPLNIQICFVQVYSTLCIFGVFSFQNLNI